MMKIKSLICLFVGLSGLLGCTKSKDGAAPPPEAPNVQVLSQIAGGTFLHGNSSINFLFDGSFEFNLESDVRYWDPNKKNNDRSKESDALCMLKLNGQSSQLKKEETDYPYLYTTKLEVTGAMVTSAKVLRSDLSSVPANEICAGFVSEILKSKKFSQRLVEFDSNHLVFFGMSFPIYNVDTFSNDSSLYYSELHKLRERYSKRKAEWAYTYFVKEGAKVDVTAEVMRDLDGEYLPEIEMSNVESLKLKVDAKQNNISISLGACGTTHAGEIELIYFDSFGLELKLKPLKRITRDSQTSNHSRDCEGQRQIALNLSKYTLGVSYFKPKLETKTERSRLSFEFPSDAHLTSIGFIKTGL